MSKSKKDFGDAGGVGEPLLQQKGSPEAKWKSMKDKWWHKSRLILYTVLLLLSSVGNTVFFKRMTNTMPNYGWYLTQISSVLYVPLFAFFAGVAGIHKTSTTLVRKFMIMGICDGLAGLFMVLGGVHTSGNMQVLLSQGVIPFTMAFSIILVGKRFHLLQSMGAVIIVLGILIAKSASTGSSGDSRDLLLFNAIFVFSLVPQAFSSVYKEIAFRGFDGDLDVNVLQFWVAGFQVCVNFLAMPIYSLSVLGPQQVPLSGMPELIIGGTKCLFFLEDQIISDCDLPGLRPCDHCQDAWMAVGGYLCFNLFFNIFTMLVIKHGSATLAFLVSTLRMPISAVAFSSELIMGDDAVRPGASDLFSLVVILAGLGAYRYGGRLLKREQRRPSQTATTSSSPLWPSPSDMWPSPSDKPGGVSSSARKWKFAPIFSMGTPALQPIFVYVPAVVVQPRSSLRVRTDLIHRLGAGSPLNSPQLRSLSPDRSPRHSPRGSRVSESLDDGVLLLPPSATGLDQPQMPSFPGSTGSNRESDFSLVGIQDVETPPPGSRVQSSSKTS